MATNAVYSYLTIGLLLGLAHGWVREDFVSHVSSLTDGHGLGIYDGSKTTIQKHPYMVSLMVGNQFQCAGAIVSPSWAITTGDCAQQVNTTAVVLAGSNDGVKGVSYNVKSVVLHPSYGQTYFDYDYGCVQISGKFKWSSKTKPVKLPKKDPKGNTPVIVTGWGSQTYGDASNGQMLQGTMQWLPKKKCASFYANYGLGWTSRMACTYNKGKTTLCSGDFSDPFVQKGVVVGLFVTTLQNGFCSKDAAPLILADIATVAPWIKTTTGAKYEDEI
ncbi:trypsin-7-like isoform X2 [Homalodisca vitripennis]|uniref:trypsin-7-like isoform X2 n=1 Tax=Homalodisca vitripennis TaxID=197043 RepID=UPI001EEA407C|nr:trypsin-7-like isoform X2 [Homalodisca vitripennis]